VTINGRILSMIVERIPARIVGRILARIVASNLAGLVIFLPFHNPLSFIQTVKQIYSTHSVASTEIVVKQFKNSIGGSVHFALLSRSPMLCLPLASPAFTPCHRCFVALA
jgi:hypothetical protein